MAAGFLSTVGWWHEFSEWVVVSKADMVYHRVKAVTTYFESEQLLQFAIAEQNTACKVKRRYLLTLQVRRYFFCLRRTVYGSGH